MESIQPPRAPSARRRPVRPPRLRSFAVLPTGPRLYRINKGSDIRSGFGDPPPGFITPHTSASEWLIYCALAAVLKFPKDPRKGPFIGYPGLWEYQANLEGGRARRGGQVPDFVVSPVGTGYGELIIRIQTARYHLFAGHRTHAVEDILLARASRYARVADIFEQDFIVGNAVDNAQAAVLEVKKALYGGKSSDPLKANTARMPRYL